LDERQRLERSEAASASLRAHYLATDPESVDWLCTLCCGTELFRRDGKKWEACPTCGRSLNG
jgi:hypothetical protein